jgi:hypothetical protein
MPYCLLPKLADKFKQALVSGKIDPAKLEAMTSDQRRSFFADIVGEADAKGVNELFESKLVLKNKELGLINWAKQVTGIKPEVRRDMVKRIEGLIGTPETGRYILNPKTEEAFLKDLASKRLGTDVTLEEARKITDLAKKVQDAKMEHMTDTADVKARIAYGNAIQDLHDYVESIKPGMNTADQIANVANVPRALTASIDFSAPFRQGFGMVNRKQFWENLKPMFKAFQSEQYYKDLQAEIITRPTYPAMQKAGLRVMNLGDKLSQREEAFMTTLLEKVPLFRRSERAYTAFLTKLRADVFDDFIQKASLAGEDVKAGSQTAKDLANVVNNFTGSGRLGSVDHASPIANALFFSPRKIAATIQKLNPKNYLDPRLSPTARREALKSLVGQVGATTALLSLASAAGYGVELNPTSSDFGKIKIGNTRIDVTGGDATYATLLARIVTGQKKSTTDETIKTLGEGFGSPTRADVLTQFFRNKLSPTAGFVADWLYGTDHSGQPFSMSAEVQRLAVPMIISTFIEASQSDPNNVLIAVAADMFGFGTNVYGSGTDWSTSQSKQIVQFKENVGKAKFDQANQEYNDSLAAKIKRLQGMDSYTALSESDKEKVITKVKNQEKTSVFHKYGFRYNQETNEVQNRSLDSMVRSLSR